jgi:hypothetical protein
MHRKKKPDFEHMAAPIRPFLLEEIETNRFGGTRELLAFHAK